MSLDVDLIDEHGESVYEFNITHNLNTMAEEAGLYKLMWRPEELGFTTAGELIPGLTDGVALLAAEPTRFEQLNPENGWGDFGGLLRVARRYLAACQDHPNATIDVSR